MGYKGVCGIKIDTVLRLIQEKQEKNKGKSIRHPSSKANGKSLYAEINPVTVIIGGFSEEEQTLRSKRCAANAGGGER